MHGTVPPHRPPRILLPRASHLHLNVRLPRVAYLPSPLPPLKRPNPRLPQVAWLEMAAIENALEAAGVEFTNGGQPGVQLRTAPADKAIPIDKLNASNDEKECGAPEIAAGPASGYRANLAHTDGPDNVALVADIAAIIQRLAAHIRKRPDDAEMLAIRIKALCRLKAWAEKTYWAGEAAALSHRGGGDARAIMSM